MKIKKSLLLLFSFLMIYGNTSVNAQSVTFSGVDTLPPPIHFTINAGYGIPNLAGNTITSQGYSSNGGNVNPIYLEIGYNYSKKGLISLYISSTQSTTGNFFWADTANNIYGYYYNVNVVTFGLSSEYHFGNSEHFSPYLGAMFGYRFININPSGDLPPIDAVNLSLSTVSYHAYAGIKWYFLKWLGLDLRAGYGNSYYGSVGLSFRFQIARDDE